MIAVLMKTYCALPRGRLLEAAQLHPQGMDENSPAFQRRARGFVPKGTTD
jgi:hypothetical protein